jgi:hypothetical protein
LRENWKKSRELLQGYWGAPSNKPAKKKMDETLCFQPIPQNRQTTEMVEEKEHVKYYYDVTSLVPSRLRDEKWRIGNTISEIPRLLQ